MRKEDKLQNQAGSIEAGKQRKPPSSSHSPAPLAAHFCASTSSVLAASTVGTRHSSAVACSQLCSFPLPSSLKYPEDKTVCKSSPFRWSPTDFLGTSEGHSLASGRDRRVLANSDGSFTNNKDGQKAPSLLERTCQSCFLNIILNKGDARICPCVSSGCEISSSLYKPTRDSVTSFLKLCQLTATNDKWHQSQSYVIRSMTTKTLLKQSLSVALSSPGQTTFRHSIHTSDSTNVQGPASFL